MKKEVQDCMTSELLFQAMQAETSNFEKNTFLAEYNRRLSIMKLTDKQINDFRKLDEFVISNGCYITSDVLLATKPFIEANMNKDSIQMDHCTFSELVYLTDVANSAYIRNHHWMSSSVWALVCEHALRCGECKSAWEVRNRMKLIGITEEQEGIFVSNECLIVQRLRWHYTDKFAW